MQHNMVSEIAVDNPLAYEDRFTDAELESFREAFAFFDKDGDGTMNCEDLGLALRSIGLLVTNKEGETLKRRVDPDSNGVLDASDFISCVAELSNKPDSEDEVKNAFSIFDKMENGMLERDEMRHVFTRIGDTLSNEELANFFALVDFHGDGYVRMEDLLSLFRPQTNGASLVDKAVEEGKERKLGGPAVDQQTSNKLGALMNMFNSGPKFY